MRYSAEKILSMTTKRGGKHLSDFDMNEVYGIVNREHTILFAPKSEDAIREMMFTYGKVYGGEGCKVKTFLDDKGTPLGMLNATHLRHFMNQHGFIKHDGGAFQSSTLRSITKLYKRNTDNWHFFKPTKENFPMVMITPCNDWWVIVAPYLDNDNLAYDIQDELAPFDMEVLL